MSSPNITPMPLDTSNGVPLYRQIVVILSNRINAGVLRPGDVISGETAVCSEFGVSRITARRALNELAAMGRVKRERGKGTHVLPFKKTVSPMNASIDGLLENVGHMGRATTVQVLECRYISATSEVAEILELQEDLRVQRAVRVRFLAGTPMSYLVTVVPRRHWPPDRRQRLIANTIAFASRRSWNSSGGCYANNQRNNCRCRGCPCSFSSSRVTTNRSKPVSS